MNALTTPATHPGNYWSCAALLVATIAVAGSLWLSIGMDLKACPLCLYQRAFVMGALAVLVVGRRLGAADFSSAALLALPAAAAATAVAAFHVYLESIGKLECPAGLFGIGTAPQQSLPVLALLTGALLLGALAGGTLRAKP